MSPSRLLPESAATTAPNVKRLHLLWYWTDRPTDPPEVRLAIDEFDERNARQELAQDTRYRIDDPSEYARWS